MNKNASLRSGISGGINLTLFLSVFSLLSCAPGDDGGPPPQPPVTPKEVGKAEVWVTSGDQTRLLHKENDVSIIALASTSLPYTVIDTTKKLQEIEGFGAALTGSSAYLIHQKLTNEQRATLLTNLFDVENGIGISYLRITIGASDFSLSDYTYDDVPAGETDEDLSSFSIAKDQDDVIPVLKQIVTVSPAIKIMASPWSPPAWMKTTETLKGGKLKPEWYNAYSSYLVKFIGAYAAEGISIDAITPQNEPLHNTNNYPSTEMQPAEQLALIKNSLGPLFQTENIDTKIIIYDHNWDHADYPITILNDATAKNFIEGSAFHAYAGSVSAMSTVHDAHPDKGLYFTEISGGAWATNFSDNLQWNMVNIFIGTTKNWSRTALLWNLALDENYGPTNNGCTNCRGVVTIKNDGTVIRNVEYYSIAHFSKFVRPGAFRVSSTAFDSSTKLDHVAFMNEDGSKVIVVTNNDTLTKGFTVLAGDRQFSLGISGKSVATIVWE
jgi:glucosylceramidase